MLGRVLLLLALCGAADGNNTTAIENLRNMLLTNIDNKVPPYTDGKTGLVVKIQFRVFKVIKVNIETGQLIMKVWRRMRWFDDRLAWDPADHAGVSTFLAYPGTGGIDNNLWMPHVVLYNSLSTMGISDGAAWVRSDGRVHHSIPSLVDITCRFSGLVQFPYDTLECPVEVASWSLHDGITNLTFFDEPLPGSAQYERGDKGCAETSVQSAATAMAYQEFKLEQDVKCLKYTRTYTCCPDSPWTQLWLVFRMKRMSGFYSRLIETPGIILVLLSFMQFWFDASAVGARLPFGTTMLLSTVVLMNVGTKSLPKCAEWLWIDILNMANLLFVVGSLVETAIVVHICFAGLGTKDEEGAERVDWWCRRIVPPLYAIAIGIVYSSFPDDPYVVGGVDGGYVPDEIVSNAPEMFEGIPATLGIKWETAIIAPIIIFVALIATVVAYKMGWDQEDVKENLVRAATTIKGKMPRRTVVMTIDQKDVVVLDEDAAPSKPAADKDVRRGGLPPVGARDGLENPLDPGE